MNQLPKNPESIWNVFCRGLIFYKNTFLYVLPLSIVYVFLTHFPSLFYNFSIASFNNPVHTSVVVKAIIGYVLSVLVMAYMLYVIFGIIHNHKIGKVYSVGFRVGLKKFIPCLIVGTIIFVFSIVGIILLVLPGIFAIIVFSMAHPFLVIDNQSIINSIKKSFSLVYPNWWRVFFLFIIMNFIPFLLMFFIVLHSQIAVAQNLLLDNIIIAILDVIVMPLFLSNTLAIFFDLKLRDEAVSLQ